MFLGAGAAGSADRNALRQTNLHETVVDFLLDIHEKLNQILSILSQDRLAKEFPIQARVVEISGAELAFIPEHPLEPGQAVEIVIALNQFPVSLAGAVGIIEKKVQTEQGPALEMSFKRIRSEDQEAVVRFVFQEERRQIREQRLD